MIYRVLHNSVMMLKECYNTWTCNITTRQIKFSQMHFLRRNERRERASGGVWRAQVNQGTWQICMSRFAVCALRLKFLQMGIYYYRQLWYMIHSRLALGGTWATLVIPMLISQLPVAIFHQYVIIIGQLTLQLWNFGMLASYDMYDSPGKEKGLDEVGEWRQLSVIENSEQS